MSEQRNNNMVVGILFLLMFLIIFVIIFLKRNFNRIRFLNEPLVINQTMPSNQLPFDLNMVIIDNGEILENNNLNCSICFDKLENNILKTPCDHYFHQNCLDEWIAKNLNNKEQNCPICRKVFNIDNN
jgi:hypothetical protein